LKVIINPYLFIDLTIRILTTEEAEQTKFKDEVTGSDLEVIDNEPLTEYFMNNYKNLVSKMEIVTDKTSEGSQFVKGIGGIGGILRYKVETNYDDDANKNDFNEDDFI